MCKNINHLRDTVFDALEQVKDGTMDVDRAKQICEIGQVIINSAKVEIEFAHKTGANVVSGFLESIPAKLPNGITGITQHRIKG